MKVNLFIRAKMHDKGVKTSLLAEALDVSLDYASQMRRGKRQIPVKYYKKISSYLDIPLEDLINLHLEDYKNSLLEAIKTEG
jgi:transcriptional regulator with XRE-family HTH domain